ncbi:ADP-ribose 1''-phosphate phosphatase [Ascochyta rabiei]|uniref:ADP-ribose 1''-phosphate phosphatase n=1 Tax=Didymella rabiei TaxID=5454 RepID=A0A163KP17_DIDRA|nr:ADP-ribose 1''-phosphate phosphatase [Ascochyta rabiei]KZM27141.1 phosphoprotein phosphatase [Ascochyta rabiei]UPX18707.1 ADP-ribose 1''-phosphate phosphatase [Ascochyta rabiei]
MLHGHRVALQPEFPGLDDDYIAAVFRRHQSHQNIIMSSLRDTSIQLDSEPAGASKAKRMAADSPPPAKKFKATTEHSSQHLDYTHVPAGKLEVSDTAKNSPGAHQQPLQLSYHTGDLFADAPRGSVLVHACNTQGHWGAGIAKAFKNIYPQAHADHNQFCTKGHTKARPVPTGTAQLLAPRDGDAQHWIGCLFTSAKYGKGKDKPDVIVRHTIESMQMLLELISQVKDEITEVRICKINSGKFGVAWERTEEALGSIVLKSGWRARIEVWEPAE